MTSPGRNRIYLLPSERSGAAVRRYRLARLERVALETPTAAARPERPDATGAPAGGDGQRSGGVPPSAV